MQNNYYFLRQVVPRLKEQLVGLKLMEAFSQEKDELVICFAAARGVKSNYKEFYIKAAVYPKFSCLYFSKNFKRAKKNSVSLLNSAYDCEVTDVVQYENERSFSVNFSNGYVLLFKLFGSRSNLLLFKDDDPVFLFNNNLVADNNLTVSELNRPIDQSFAAFAAADGNYKKLFPTFGKIVAAYFSEKNYEELALNERWGLVAATLKLLSQPAYYLVQLKDELHLSLLPIGEVLQEFSDPLEASNAFFVKYSQLGKLLEEKAIILRKLRKEKKQTDSYLTTNYERLENVDSSTSNEQKGHLIMANLHEILPRSENVEVLNFYTDEPITIKLKAEASPQKNAEWYYRKAKNERIEVEKLTENIELREAKLALIESTTAEIEAIDDLKSLRNYLKINNLTLADKDDIVIEPFKRMHVDEFEVWVGKNAKSNDVLTQQYSFKEDLWMHVRDAAGSHVLLKHRAGKKFPTHVIEQAAGIAAYHSKRKTEALVPVIVTPKKFVRKAKGLAPGQVIVEKEEVIMVEPTAGSN